MVGDGVQCLNAARDRVPDVLVLEYELPWGGGDGVLARLREEIPLASVDVVLVTCDYSEEELAHELAPPVGGCLRKPFRLRELSDMVRSVTQQSPPQTAGGRSRR
jgi:DNA-binding response OmpR family regulator